MGNNNLRILLNQIKLARAGCCTSSTGVSSSPLFKSAAMSTSAPTTLIIVMNKPLNANVPATSAFAVTVGGASRSVTSVQVVGSTVRLTLSSAVTSGQVVVVTYTVPGSNPLQDANGVPFATFTNKPVTNAIPAVPATQLATPTGLQLTAGDTTILVGWTSVSNASAYNVRYSNNPGMTGATIISAGSSPVTLTGLTNGTQYYVDVQALSGSSSYTNSNYTAALTATPIVTSSQSYVYWGWSVAAPTTLNQILAGQGLGTINHGDDVTADFTANSSQLILWMAEDVNEPLKIHWDGDGVGTLNQGDIGTSNDLFDAPTVISGLRLYASAYATSNTTNPIVFKSN